LWFSGCGIGGGAGASEGCCGAIHEQLVMMSIATINAGITH